MLKVLNNMKNFNRYNRFQCNKKSNQIRGQWFKYFKLISKNQ
jgi:hypothetical protein